MSIEHDILDLLELLPDEINNASTTTELKFLTVGAVLMACHDEIKRLRGELAELRGKHENQ